jgi:hypothetical protein
MVGGISLIVPVIPPTLIVYTQLAEIGKYYLQPKRIGEKLTGMDRDYQDKESDETFIRQCF